MMHAIQQSVEFKVPPETLYETYIDSRQHSAATGSPAKLGRKVGARFTAFDGSLLGRNLAIVPNQMVVQSWRADHWKATDTDSILVLTFTKVAKGGRVDLFHVNVPEHDHRAVSEGWRKYYWNPWRAYFARLSRESASPVVF